MCITVQHTNLTGGNMMNGKQFIKFFPYNLKRTCQIFCVPHSSNFYAIQCNYVYAKDINVLSLQTMMNTDGSLRSREYLKGVLALLHKAKTAAVSRLSDAVDLFHNTEEIRMNYVSLQDDVREAYTDYELDIFMLDTSDSNVDTDSNDDDNL